MCFNSTNGITWCTKNQETCFPFPCIQFVLQPTWNLDKKNTDRQTLYHKTVNFAPLKTGTRHNWGAVQKHDTSKKKHNLIQKVIKLNYRWALHGGVLKEALTAFDTAFGLMVLNLEQYRVRKVWACSKECEENIDKAHWNRVLLELVGLFVYIVDSLE